MYSTRTGLILAFHGCDESIIDDVLQGKKILNNSKNSYDWLGHGAYFWDSSPSRALEFATTLSKKTSKSKNKINNPAVIGAIINLGFCLDLLDYQKLTLVKEAYDLLATTCNISGTSIPVNKKSKESKDLLIRELDCAVIETLHQFRKQEKMPAFDSVRGVFWEGEELYTNSGFREKDHIQICIRNPNCIKGYFLPQILNKKFTNV
ncbi:MAG: hypothetical protein K2Q21_06765 [Chitinophagaceae bacterium]|nr:hypothetical protein [Chitinophagaceae bacterium]